MSNERLRLTRERHALQGIMGRPLLLQFGSASHRSAATRQGVAKAILNGRTDRLGDMVFATTGLDDGATLRLACCDRQKGSATRFVLRQRIGFEAVGVLSSARNTFQPDLGGHVEDEGQIGPQSAQGEAVKSGQNLIRHAR